MAEKVITESFNQSFVIGLLVCAIVGIIGAMVYMYKQYDKKVTEKDERNRQDTEERIQELKALNEADKKDLKADIAEFKEERKTDKKFMEEIIETNKQLSSTNKEMADRLFTEVKDIGKKVDKIETIITTK